MTRAWTIVGIGTVVLFCREPASLRAAAADTRPATTRAATRAVATRPANHDELATEMIRWSDDVSAILAIVTDEATAKAAVPRLDEAADRILALRDATERLGPAGPEVMARHGQRLREATTRFMGEAQRIEKDPALSAILEPSLERFKVFGVTRTTHEQ
jgi:hypothetical protein